MIKIHDTDLSDHAWKLIKPFIPPAKKGGRPRSIKMRKVINGILYVLRTGSQWRNLGFIFKAGQSFNQIIMALVKISLENIAF